MSKRIIRAYGQDFSKIENATFSEWKNGRFEPIERCLEMLEAFLDTYKSDPINPLHDQDLDPDAFPDTYKTGLRFYANRDLFGHNVGIVRNKCLTFLNKTESQIETVDFTLQLGCRFDSNERAWFLGTMLLDGQDGLMFKEPTVQLGQDMIFDILLFWMFRRQLEDAAKKGIFRAYHRFENNDDRPRGAPDISRHIRLNAGLDNGRIAYSYREHTENNSLNRLIAAAYHRLKERFFNLVSEKLDCDQSLSAAIAAIRLAVGSDPLNTRQVIRENLRPIAHPFFHEYEALRKTCLKILRYEGVSVFDADCCEETESLLMDVTKLWERFLENRIRLRPEFANGGCSLNAQESRHLFAERTDKSAKPDFVIYQGKKPFAVLDAKFKCHWDDFFNEGSSDCVDDDINKCIRDMVVFNTRRTGVIFPAKRESGEESYRSYHIGNKEAENSFDMVRVPIPQIPQGSNGSFAEWKRKLDDQVDASLTEYLEGIATKK